MKIYCVFEYLDNRLVAIFTDEWDAKDYAEDIYFVEEHVVEDASQCLMS